MTDIKLFCVKCKKSRLKFENSKYYCENSECSKSVEPFRLFNNKPVFIDFDNSIFSEDNFTEQIKNEVVGRISWKYKSVIKRIVYGVNNFTKYNLDFISNQIDLINAPKILIIGGGEVGHGLEDFYAKYSDSIVAFDVYDSPNIHFIADAHSIPVQDNFFDAVIIQAVLEHVLDPAIVVSEIYRVLKTGGIVYSETPFMQQVHEGPYDFTRFTESGHRYLFKNFSLVKSGYTKGVGSTMLWSLDFLVSGIFRNRTAGKLTRLVFFWIRFIDSIVPYERNIDGACGVFFLGKKELKCINSIDIIAHYKGAQKSGVSSSNIH